MSTAERVGVLDRQGAERRTTVTFPRVLAAEQVKLLGLRSTVWVPVGTVAAAATLVVALALFVRPGDGQTGASLVVASGVLAQLGTLAFGVLVGTGEFSTGTAQATFTAVPRRLPVLGAQALVTAAVTLVTATACVLAALPALGPADLALDAGNGETQRMLLGFLGHLTGVALLGLGLGALVRHQAAAVSVALGLLVVADSVLAANPGRVADTVRVLLPGAGSRVLHDDARLAALDAASDGLHLGRWESLLVLAVWAGVVGAAAAYRLRRHDVT